MFENVGSKVKALAVIVFFLGIIGSIICAIIIWASRIEGAFLRGLLTLALGCFGSWLGTVVTYAIGQAAESAETSEGRIKTLQDKIDQLQQSLKNSGGNAAGNTPQRRRSHREPAEDPIFMLQFRKMRNGGPVRNAVIPIRVRSFIVKNAEPINKQTYKAGKMRTSPGNGENRSFFALYLHQIPGPGKLIPGRERNSALHYSRNC